MSSLQSLRELINERLAAAAEEICRLCEGTIVQYEQELCRQRRLLDVVSKQQLQMHAIGQVLPQHHGSEEVDICNQQRNLRVQREEPQPPQTKEELEKQEPLQFGEYQREPEPWQIKEEQEDQELTQFEEEQEELVHPQIKEETEEICISQDENQLDLKQVADTLMEFPPYEDRETELAYQQSFNVTDSEDEAGNQHEESTSTTDEETDPQNRDQRKRRDKSHVQSVDSSDILANQWYSGVTKNYEKASLVKKRKQSPKENSLSSVRSDESSRKVDKKIFYTKTETDDRLYIHTESVKDVAYWSKFRTHMRTQRGKKPFICKECAKCFRDISSLKRHMRTHTGEKPFSCKECHTSFSQLCSVKRHMKTHTGEKPFSCKECDLSFSRVSHLKRHMKTHTGDFSSSLF